MVISVYFNVTLNMKYTVMTSYHRKHACVRARVRRTYQVESQESAAGKRWRWSAPVCASARRHSSRSSSGVHDAPLTSISAPTMRSHTFSPLPGTYTIILLTYGFLLTISFVKTKQKNEDVLKSL